MDEVQTAEWKEPSIFVKIKSRVARFKRSFEMSNYEKHALREFEYAGWMKDGKWLKDDDGDNMQEYMCKQVLQLLRVFSKHGHSGTSHGYALNLFKTLAAFDPIGTIKCTDDEWNDLEWDERGHTVIGHNYQNKRLSSVFKDGKEGKPYYLDAIVWSGEESYDTFTGMVEDVKSRQFIKLPFSPKTFYIDVVRKKVDYDDKEGERVVACGTGNYVYSIKDRKQLEEVAEYYEMELK